MDLTYFPFAAGGLALRTAWISDAALSRSCSAVKAIFPTGTWMIDVLSTRNSTLPALISCSALATSNVTVPVFGFGIRPRGPRTLPRFPTEGLVQLIRPLFDLAERRTVLLAVFGHFTSVVMTAPKSLLRSLPQLRAVAP